MVFFCQEGTPAQGHHCGLTLDNLRQDFALALAKTFLAAILKYLWDKQAGLFFDLVIQIDKWQIQGGSK